MPYISMVLGYFKIAYQKYSKNFLTKLINPKGTIHQQVQSKPDKADNTFQIELFSIDRLKGNKRTLTILEIPF